MTERDIIRRLQDSPVPPPPEDLAARIINDIPDDIEIHPDLAEADPGRRFIHRRPVWLAAAAAAAVALTAAVTWELRNETPNEAVFSQSKTADGADHEQRLEVAPLQKPDEPQPPTPNPAVEGAKPNNTWSMIGVTDTRARGDETPDAATSVDTDVSAELKRQSPERDQNATVQSSQSTTATSEEQLKRSAEQQLSQRRSKAVSPDSPPLENRSRRAGDGYSADGAGRRETGAQGAGLGSVQPRSGSTEREESTATGGTNPGFTDEITLYSPSVDLPPEPAAVDPDPPKLRSSADRRLMIPDPSPSSGQPSTGGTAEPNDKPYGNVFFEHSGVNPFVDSEDDALSTFGLDVDTGSYTVTRRYLRDGNLPPREAIRVEEFVNSFNYGDTAPRRDDFRLTAEGSPSVFMHGERYYTLRLAVKAREVDADDRPAAVLVFCIDVSGSMARGNRLELVKKALFELLENLQRDDHVGLVTYGSTGEVLLRPTTNHDEIRRAIDRLRSGGSTNAEEGLSLAYDLLDDGEDDGRIRRVILCSDGVANVGRTGPASILERIHRETGEGIELTTVGFGMGNYNDTLMEQLADAGDGRYAYVDDITEARRIFVEELTGTLLTLGREAKAQVEFDPKVVSRWRLLGYENRDIADERFRDPTVDAGEIGAGHTVTALYEVKLQDDVSRNDTVATLRFRYRPTGREDAVEMDEKLRVSDLAKSWEKASPSLKLASLVAEFAELLKGTYWSKDGNFEEVLVRLQNLQSDYSGDTRVAELTGLVARAAALQPDKAKADYR